MDTIEPLKAFESLDLRVGRIIRAEINEQARKPAYKLWIDFGEARSDTDSPGLGVRTSSAQITELYRSEELEERLVIAAVNLGERRIAGFLSQVLVLGLPDAQGRVVLLQPEREVPLGGRVY